MRMGNERPMMIFFSLDSNLWYVLDNGVFSLFGCFVCFKDYFCSVLGFGMKSPLTGCLVVQISRIP